MKQIMSLVLFFVALVLFFICGQAHERRAHVSAPQFAASEYEYSEALRSLKGFVNKVTNLPGFRPDGKPLFFLHPPNTKVHGTVVIFHGYSQSASRSAVQAKALFDQKFNTVAFNLPGYAQEPSFWASTVMRESAGYSRLRKSLQEDAVLGPIVSQFGTLQTDEQKGGFYASQQRLLLPLVFQALNESLAPTELLRATEVVQSLLPGRVAANMEKDFRKNFISAHQRFESDPLSQLQAVQALPGPVFAMGYSLGAVAVMNLAAQSKLIAGAAFLAPYMGRFTAPAAQDFTWFRALLGSLDLESTTLQNPLRVFSGKVTAVISPAGSLINRDAITNSVRENTRSLCILAEDDSIIDVHHTLEVCRSKIAGKTFVYSSRLKVNHFVTPETGSNYSDAMLEQIGTFFVTGEVDRTRFETPNSRR